MCMDAGYGFTMAGLLGDPLIQLMMRSDGVTERAHAELLSRVRDTLVARNGTQADSGMQAAGG